MNCTCGFPAVSRTVQKEGINKGKQFYICGNSKCNFFLWKGSERQMPKSVKSIASSPVRKKESETIVKLFLHKFEEFPSMKLWFSAVTNGPTALLATFYSTISENKKFYNINLRLWIFDFEIYEDFISTLLSSHYSPSIDVVELPRFITIGLKKYFTNLSNSSLDETVSLPETLIDIILPFQIEGVIFVIRHGGRAMIADEMGSGKTIQAIAAIQHYKKHWPVLILMPPSLIAQWASELQKFMGSSLNHGDVCICRKSNDAVTGKISIVSYTVLEKLVEKEKLR
jgi:SNF2 family DNA or RNA helicase